MIYKGYELMKAVSEGKLNLKQKVSTTSLEYKNCTIEFVLKDIAFNIMDLDFELIEDKIDVEKIYCTNNKQGIITVASSDNEKEKELRKYIVNNCKDIDEILKEVKRIDKRVHKLEG